MKSFLWFSLLSLNTWAGAPLDGWTAFSPREELKPVFSRSEDGGLVITHDEREGLDGSFQKAFEIEGGKWYRFAVKRKLTGVERPRQSCLVRISWADAKGTMVKIDERPVNSDPALPMPSAEPEYPADGATDADGWTLVSGVYQAPTKATQGMVELHLQWAPGGKVEWRDMVLAPCEPPSERKVKLATVHYRPSGKSPRTNCEEFAPLVVSAAQKGAQLVVLGETVPSANVKAKPEEIAEVIPGPSTKYFGQLAAQNKLHVVLSLYEREAHLIYNTAVLLGPDGALIGKYRKVTLPPSEAAKGIAPGKDYPVFDTTLGKVGMMVCYDGFFPEVARELSKNGAEIIAWPVWGCNPKLAAARACENHVYVISSTFMDSKAGWMISAVYDHNGDPLAASGEWGTVAIAEVVLNKPYIGPYNLGDFRSMLPRHRPPLESE
jgi:predicted amidohydrolase